MFDTEELFTPFKLLEKDRLNSIFEGIENKNKVDVKKEESRKLKAKKHFKMINKFKRK